MRPVARGTCPLDQDGNQIQLKDYQNARRDLISRLGQYCSYCEMRLDASLAVEHKLPKKPLGANILERELCWDNFLLACTNCNSNKGNTEVGLTEYLWPDRDNTFRALRYGEGGVISSEPNIAPNQAEKLLHLLGLQKTPDHANASDRRWLNRKEAWDMATRAKARLARVSPDNFKEMQQQIIETATAQGYWSVWMTVFRDQPDMLALLIAAIPGTCAECFDAADHYHAIARSSGQC